MKRRGNRRYYQHHEVLLVRRIRDLLYEQGFTISGARNRLGEMGLNGRGRLTAAMDEAAEAAAGDELSADAPHDEATAEGVRPDIDVEALRADLLKALQILS